MVRDFQRQKCRRTMRRCSKCPQRDRRLSATPEPAKKDQQNLKTFTTIETLLICNEKSTMKNLCSYKLAKISDIVKKIFIDGAPLSLSAERDFQVGIRWFQPLVFDSPLKVQYESCAKQLLTWDTSE